MRVCAVLLFLPFLVNADDELKMFEILNAGHHALQSIEGQRRPSVTEVIDKADVIIRGIVVDVTPYAHIVMDTPTGEEVALSFEVALIVEVDSVMKGQDILVRGNRIFVRRVVTWPGENRSKVLRDNLYKKPITMVLNVFDPPSITKDNPLIRHALYPESEVGPGDIVYSLIDRRAVWINHEGKMMTPLAQDGE